MNSYVTIATFTFPSELAIVRGRLESEGIECYVADELTVQVHNFYSNALGGIKLQVNEKQAAEAIEILKELGYLKEDIHQPTKFNRIVEKATRRIPGFNKASVELRLVVLIALLLTGIAIGFIVANFPSAFESLTEKAWCVSHITYDGKNYAPKSVGITISGPGYCEEGIDFKSNGDLLLPGFNTNSIWGAWQIENGRLIMKNIDTLGYIYSGTYSIDVNDQSMKLTSDKTTIHCFQSRY